MVGVSIVFSHFNVKDLAAKASIRIDDGVETSAVQKGSGLQRMLYFSLLKTIQRRNRLGGGNPGVACVSYRGG